MAPKAVAPIIGLILCALTVSGCAYKLILQERGGRAAGTGSATSDGTGSSGAVKITVDGRTYDGQWIYASEGATGYVTTFGAQPSTSYIGLFGGAGNGTMLLRDPSGRPLNCQFRYSENSGTGAGVCQDDEDRTFDMQITMQ